MEPNDENISLTIESVEKSFEVIWALLVSPKASDDIDIEPIIQQNENYARIITFITDLRELSAALNQGDLNKFVDSRGYVIAQLKALQSNLRHLTWQTKKIADGDFTQKVDFLGEFSNAFNEMTLKLMHYNNELVRMANFDALTEIPNRHSLHSFLDEAFDNFTKFGTPFSIMIIDIDHFKNVNDTYGHDIGDLVLVDISNTLKNQFRSTDIFARYGGEEFLAVLPNIEIDTALKIARRLIKIIDGHHVKASEELSLHITISIGVSQVIREDNSCQDIIKRSDNALYEAKNSGRNRAIASRVEE